MFFQESISFNSEGISFELDQPELTHKWISETILNEGKVVGEISYVFCSDEYLHKINLEHLGHDTYTDIITFNYCEDNVVSTDIFISIDRVKENAKIFGVSFQKELNRVIIHGILHLLGYDDKTDEDKVLMRSKEDFYLTLC
ncbi:MAG: rRNA maturation RNase YbeY [Vicingaceae bacterium]